MFRSTHRRVAAKRLWSGVVAAGASGALAGTAMASPPSDQYRLVWGDEFNGNFLDGGKWNHNYPWGTNHDNANDATMSPDQVALGDGTMTLTATRTGPGSRDFVSGAINTGYTKKTFNGGYIEAKIKLPSTIGSFPAFWGLYDGWPPEADIMEYPLGAYGAGDYHTAFHYRNTSGGNSAGAGRINNALGNGAPLHADYHTFGMEWREDDWVGYYFDGRLVSQIGDDNAIRQMERMYLILNYAVGSWAPTPTLDQWAIGHSDQTKVDWVRVWDTTSSLDRTSRWIGGSGSFDNAANWSDGTIGQGNQHMVFSASDGVTRTVDWSGERRTGDVALGGSSPFVLGNGGASFTMSDVDGSPNITVLPGTTAAHEIRGVLDPVGTLDLANDGNASLLVSGVIRGSETILVNGTAPVVLSGSNRHSGNTIVDGGSQGPAILRLQHSNALGTGTLVFQPQGNATTGQAQLAGGISVANNVSLSGRNNGTYALLNAGGDNVLSGDLDIQVGGGFYGIASDDGTLTLAGTLRSNAGGTRTLALGGAAQGVVSGSIANGNATVNVVKAGVGTWTFDGTQTYTGTTVVDDGTLLVDGTHAANAGYTVNANGVLGGGGTIVGNVALNGGGLEVALGEALLTINGGLSLASNATLRLEGDASEGMLLASFAPGRLSGTFDQILLDGNDVTGDFGVLYDNAGGELRLTAVPEPALAGVVALGLSVMTLRRRRLGDRFA